MVEGAGQKEWDKGSPIPLDPEPPQDLPVLPTGLGHKLFTYVQMHAFLLF